MTRLVRFENIFITDAYIPSAVSTAIVLGTRPELVKMAPVLFALEDMGRDRAADMIRRHGAERVLFGTDWPWRDQAASLAFLHSLGLSDEQERGVRGANAARLLGLG